MQSFPERQASFEKLYHTLDVINEAQAEKTFTDGMYYKRIGKVASAEFYFGKIPQRWPNRPVGRQGQDRAGPARQAPAQTLEALQDHHPTPAASTAVWAAWAWGGMGMGGMGMGGMGMGGMGMGGMGRWG